MRIGLFGIYGVYNFGCEAIVRGTSTFIKMHYPDCQVVYFSRNYAYDSQALKDMDIEIIEIRSSNNLLKKIFNKVCSLFWIESRMPAFEAKKVLNDVDALFFIGGDIFTIPAILRENAKYPYVNELVEFGKRVVKRNIPIILYGASVGPFGEYEKAVSYYKNALQKYRKIVCRETVTMAYLKSFGLDNVVFSPDPAFLVNGKRNKNAVQYKKEYIGINLSPLSLNELYSNGADQIVRMKNLLLKIYGEFKEEILLLPHVVSEDENDNDYIFMKSLVNSMTSEEQEHFHIAEYKDGFLEIKEQLYNCKMVVSARMHCAINAMHEGIPTILLSYSQKSIGMCKYVYGIDKWVLPIKGMEEKLLPAMKDMMLQNADIEEMLIHRNSEIQQYLLDNRNVIKKSFGELSGDA
ncbi:polysaccharide pyruvyl transferase family protein [Eisenbergiella porci]|uniref:polysaccharide pyruvyl transferase family protein n=1 Tax=Eisenbergiella porci TaxID=2652274 RepID=UPI002A81AB12|nr:polysaccharide pyruvyl transferase family protein [Eisenbergiella porci]